MTSISTNRDLEIIKDWLKKEPHLPDEWDEQRLLAFLHCCDFSLEKVKRKLEMYFTLKGALPEFFTNCDIDRPELQEILDLGYLITLPELTPDGNRISIFGTYKRDFDTLNVQNLAKIVFMMSDVRLGIKEYSSSGEIFIINANMNFAHHLAQMSLTVFKKFLIFVQQALPYKIKGIHIVNPDNFFHILLNTIKQFLKEKIRNRIHIHTNLETLHHHVPQSVLPVEYGGTAGTIQQFQDEWLKYLQEHKNWFKQQEMVKADESKRLGEPTTYENLFGLDGSFRQLAID